MRFSLLALTAFAGLSAAKRGCRHDKNNPGWGWYFVVQGDDLNSIAADFNEPATQIFGNNKGAFVKDNMDSLKSWVTIYVKCP
ncbi:hypothetical protein E4U42_005626 [Claviceps africana]|uniref:LysM domain-containing protein n=1 Tax=Claviceps africana TaxID=83212 RepID=A0A8K0NFF6_9HYPO|nr:hypothetical protein E4U42_005626 [Claviceps africana]